MSLHKAQITRDMFEGHRLAPSTRRISTKSAACGVLPSPTLALSDVRLSAQKAKQGETGVQTFCSTITVFERHNTTRRSQGLRYRLNGCPPCILVHRQAYYVVFSEDAFFAGVRSRLLLLHILYSYFYTQQFAYTTNLRDLRMQQRGA